MTMMNDIHFYDTCSLLIAGDRVFEENDKFLISSITFNELERIKSANNKSPEVKYSARLLLHLFDNNKDKYEVVLHKGECEQVLSSCGFEINDDAKILSDAIYANNNLYADEVIFVTNDLALSHIANQFFGDKMIERVDEEADSYTGYLAVHASDECLEEFYSDTTKNLFDLLRGQYLILYNSNEEVVDLRCWTGDDHRYINCKPFKSVWFGDVVPYNNDIYQKLLFDSLRNNKLTLVSGPAGSGKSIVSLAYLMAQLEHHNLDKIIVFCNTVATANSAKLGYYPGTKNDKLLDSQIGNMLASKLGGRDGVNQLINEERLVLLPMSDIRGYDTSGMKAGIYISEAQNLDRSLMKLALQRIGDDSVCIIDGDARTQVDLPQYEGNNNGMKRVSKIFRGTPPYGEVVLKNIQRSEIAKIAENI